MHEGTFGGSIGEFDTIYLTRYDSVIGCGYGIFLQNVTEHLWNQSTLFTQFIFVFSSERIEKNVRNKPNLDPDSKKLLIKRDPDPQPCLRVFKQ